MSKKILSDLLLLCVFGLSLFAGCTSPKDKNVENNVEFDSIKVEKTYHLMESPDNPNCNLQINFVFPSKYTNKDILERIQQSFITLYFGENYINKSPQEATNQYVEDYLSAYKDLEKDFQSELEKDPQSPVGAWFSYFEMSSDKIAYNKNDLISFTINFENYTGGAHGSHSYQNHVINLKNGAIVLEEDIFIPNFQDELASIIINKLVEQNNLKDPKELENIGFFSVEEIVPNSNFLITDEGLTYTFNEYEIAAYAVGAINVFLPYNEIDFLLKKDGPLGDMAAN